MAKAAGEKKCQEQKKNNKYRQVDIINLTAIKPKQNKTGRKKKKRRPVNNLDKR